MDTTGGNPKKLTKGYGNEASPTWSPDGERIAFVSDRSGSPQIYVMARDGSNVRRLTFEGSYNTNPSWSPKGDRIAFCGRIEGHYHIFTIGIDGSGLRSLTSNCQRKPLLVSGWSLHRFQFNSNRGIQDLHYECQRAQSEGFNIIERR